MKVYVKAGKGLKRLKFTAERIRRLRETLGKLGLDAYLCFQPANIRYLTGSQAAGELAYCLLVPSKGKPLVFISEMGWKQAAGEIGEPIGLKPVKLRENFYEKLRAETRPFRTLGFDDASYSRVEKLKGEGLALKHHPEAVARLREVKGEEEIKAIGRAVRLAEEAMEAAREAIKPGVSELEVAAAAERALRLGGSEFYAFATLVASGGRASYPHAQPSPKKIRRGEPVVVDLGARVSGYCADLTRTFIVGKPENQLARVCEAVLEARGEALKRIKPGISGSEADGFARAILREYGFDEAFPHGLGHGVGLEVHEPPRLAPASSDRLVEGMVFTVEPGVYLAGKFGVRVEDTVLLESGGVKPFTWRFRKELISML